MLPVTAESIFYRPFEPYPMIVEDLIPGGLTVLAGTPKIGKSWMALDLAISVAEGIPFLGKSVHKTGVLYYCLEDTYMRIRNRMHELADEPPDDLYFTTTSERIGSGFTRDIVNFLRDHRDVELIIVDTLQKVRGSDDGSGSGSYSKDYEEVGKLKEIADLNNKSVIVIHHLRKMPDPNDPFNEIAGTNGITGVSDTNIVLKRTEGSMTAEMFIRGRDVEERKFMLEYAFPRWKVLDETGSRTSSHKSAHGSEALLSFRKRSVMTASRPIRSRSRSPATTTRSSTLSASGSKSLPGPIRSEGSDSMLTRICWQRRSLQKRQNKLTLFRSVTIVTVVTVLRPRV